MIENSSNPERGLCGRHHGLRRGAMGFAAGDAYLQLGIRQIAVFFNGSPAGCARLGLASNLAASLGAALVGSGTIPVEAPIMPFGPADMTGIGMAGISAFPIADLASRQVMSDPAPASATILRSRRARSSASTTKCPTFRRLPMNGD